MLRRMNAAQMAIVIGVSLVLLTAIIAVMSRANRRERRRIERRHADWIAEGSNPEEKPNFYAGPPSSGTPGGL
jgi:hypothetical protein